MYKRQHNNLGVANKSIGQISNAAKNFEKAIEINPSYTMAILNLGLIHKNLGQIEESIFCFERVLDIEPDNDQAKVNLEELRSE